MFRPITLLAILIVSLTLVGQALGDGKVFSKHATAKVNIPDQEALIHFADGVETLIIQTSFTGEGDEFAWVVPTPSKPDVTASTTGLFPTLRTLTAPLIRGRSTPIYFLLLLVPAVILGIAAGHPLRTLYCLILFILLYGILTPSYSTASLSGSRVGIQLHQYKVVGDYEVAMLSASGSASVADWLSDNGFHTSQESKDVIDTYAAEGWFLTAARLTRDANLKEAASTHPLAFRFTHDEPIYPMRLTATGSDALDVDLYVFGPQYAVADGFDAAYCNRVVFPPPVTFDEWARPTETDAVQILHPELRQRVDASDYVTKLSAHLTPSQMRQDVTISWAGDRIYKPVLWTHPNARNAGCNAALIALSLALMSLPLVYRKRAWLKSEKPKALRYVLMAVIGSLLIGWVIYTIIPKTDTKPHKVYPRTTAHHLSDTASKFHLPTDVDAAIEEIDSDRIKTFEDYLGLLGVYPLLVEARGRCEDSPGNVTYEWTDEGLVFIYYNQQGAPLRIDGSDPEDE